MSVALLVPINKRAVTWTANDHPADYRAQQRRWDRLHYARVAMSRGWCLRPPPRPSTERGMSR